MKSIHAAFGILGLVLVPVICFFEHDVEHDPIVVFSKLNNTEVDEGLKYLDSVEVADPIYTGKITPSEYSFLPKEEDIRSAIELKLRSNKIECWTSDEGTKQKDGVPNWARDTVKLCPMVSVIVHKDGSCTYSVQIEARTVLMVERKKKPIVFEPIVWNESFVAHGGSQLLKGGIKDDIDNIMNDFSNEYLKANPIK